ncbi:hypothetical protein GCM10010218_30660 [Streptomyces mashuensis]|uniref:Tetratricopeptide repeat protein n=1 Tax=Streptomyces mashuensis TaxID=33904 RepID=A0A919ED92_9ACTN|nr:hypothetical protein [Streptomyces mashuensis]GHF47221.1 hypothetical protein GCM10010218_30660 [Streptomyces mashuensis]
MDEVGGGDVTMERIGEAIALLQSGDAAGARRRFDELWAAIGEDGDAFHRCVLAHYMADVQDDPHEELAWDLRALEAADSLTDARVQQHHATLAVRGFYPSLHLNVAAAYEKVGAPDRARTHLAKARAHTDALGDDAYGEGIRGALDRLEERLAAEAATGAR